MPEFSKFSMSNLMTCDERLQDLFETVIEYYDCRVLEGHRGEEAQEEAYRNETSNARWGQSKHNFLPSLAVDVVPYPVDWEDTERFYHFAGFVKGIAESMDIKVRWGGDWDGDTDLHDQSLYDLPHWELLDDAPVEPTPPTKEKPALDTFVEWVKSFG